MKDESEKSGLRTLRLEVSALSPIVQVAWLIYCAYFLEKTGSGHHLEIFGPELDDKVRKFASSGFLEHRLSVTLTLRTARPELNLLQDFAFLSSSRLLSRKLVARFKLIHLSPKDLPGRIDSRIYWQDVAERRYLSLVSEALKLCGWSGAKEEFVEMRRRFAPSHHNVALATSIFDGDRFLEGFLQNISGLTGYESCEHFLVRAASPGNEHDVLVQFVNRSESAVYLNLAEDPGLYAVWNLVASLATAKFLSNANLDDRRDPEHVLRLARVLEEERRVDVASTPIRVTEDEGKSWAQSRRLRTFFGGKDSSRGVYTFHRLVRLLPDGAYAANNLPHCMPLWRRELHARFGFFQEREFGPSADWEFWLRCGLGGARFYLYPKALGLYLKSSRSYWNRATTRNFDQAILNIYLEHCLDQNLDRRGCVVESSLVQEELNRLEETGAWFVLFARLVCWALNAARFRSESERMLLDEYARRHFGVEQFCSTIQVPAVHCAHEIPTVNRIFECALYCLAEYKHVLSAEHIAKKWQCLFIDYCDMQGCDDGLIAVAYVYHVRGKLAQAWRLLREAHLRSGRFWPLFQTLFRFEYSLSEALENLGADEVMALEGARKSGSPVKRIWFYPAYKDNHYQDLLYRPLIERGATIVGLRGHGELDSLSAERVGSNVVHLHWVHEVFKRAETRSDMRRMSSRFLRKVQALRRRGLRVVWTVHNYLSHEAKWPAEEWRFRRSLAAAVDEVFVHHPMVVDMIDWLPETVRPCLVEHGSYDPPECWREKRLAARDKLALSPQEQVIVWFGQIRPYKQLERYLPVLIDWLKTNRDARLLVLGKIHVSEVRDILHAAPIDRVLLRDEYISDGELDDYLYAADWGVLCYKDILTSGALFYMLSRGLPVVAPDKGTIPAYVINGWNGFVYGSVESFRALLNSISRFDAPITERMHDNALQLAKKVDWRFGFQP